MNSINPEAQDGVRAAPLVPVSGGDPIRNVMQNGVLILPQVPLFQKGILPAD